MEVYNKSFGTVNDSNTESEIASQPELWIKLYSEFSSIRDQLKTYLRNLLNDKNTRIILTGAGSSAFIGEVLLGAFSRRFSNPITAVATTDLVTHPELFFNNQSKYLLISFARSGNSPESAQAIVVAEDLSQSVFHLIVTCNNESDLLESVSSKNKFIFVLPSEANDKGLAMTASFTSMLLAGLLISRIDKDNDNLDEQIALLSKYGNKILNVYSEPLRKIASSDFKRAVFLGSGMLKGIARESQLKLQELTDGKIICKHDSFMGFRHGPKAVLDGDTLMVYLFSNNSYAGLYERDLVAAIEGTRKPLCSIGVMEDDSFPANLDLKIVLSDDEKMIHEDFLSVAMVMTAQLLGLFKSISLGLDPDSPSESGMIHRVVQGVKIYPYTNGKSDHS